MGGVADLPDDLGRDLDRLAVGVVGLGLRRFPVRIRVETLMRSVNGFTH